MNRESFVFYGSFYEALKELNETDRLAVYDAICSLALTGDCGELSGVPKAIIALIRPQIEANNRRYENGKSKKQTASKSEANDKQDGSKPEAKAKQTTSKRQAKPEQTGSKAEPNVNVNVNENVNVNANVNENENVNGNGNAAKPKKRRAHGEYGWVKLSDAEYDRLLADLGQTELDRCIQHIDELAQSSGNKNEWSDWNLVLRRCNRERWGIRQKQQEPQHGSMRILEMVQRGEFDE